MIPSDPDERTTSSPVHRSARTSKRMVRSFEIRELAQYSGFMLVRTCFRVKANGSISEAIANLEGIDVDERTRVITVPEDDHTFRLHVEREVDPDLIEVVGDSGRYTEDSKGERTPLPALRIRGDERTEGLIVERLLEVVSFLTDISLYQSRLGNDDRFVPESESDERLLKDLGADTLYSQTFLAASQRSFGLPVDESSIFALGEKAAGLHLYRVALEPRSAATGVALFWKILESAFGEKGGKLTELLARYEPCRQLGFDKDELEAYRTLRGRASHLHSRDGLSEAAYVERKCVEKLPRIKNLAERVIVTKKPWGSRSLAYEDLAPLVAYTSAEGVLTIKAGSTGAIRFQLSAQ